MFRIPALRGSSGLSGRATRWVSFESSAVLLLALDFWLEARIVLEARLP